MFVLKNKLTGKFIVGRYGGETDDLQKARTFSRKGDSSNARPYRLKKEDVEAVPVMLVLIPDELIAPAPVVAPEEPHPFPIFQPQACVGD